MGLEENASREETRAIDRIAELSEKNIKGAQRDQHPKQHGCVWAEFTVPDDLPEVALDYLPEKVRQGIFATPNRFHAWIRFSNGGAEDDSKGDLIYGMAIKVMGVKGKKVLPEEENAETQDFVLSTIPAFFVKNNQDYVELLERREAAHNNVPLAFLTFIFSGQNPFRWRWQEGKVLFSAILKQLFKKPVSPLEQTYWSTTPYQLGFDDQLKPQPIKFFVRPAPENRSGKKPGKTVNYMRENLVEHLSKRAAYFDFYVQFQNQQDPDRTPVENPSIEWKGCEEYRVARIYIPPQKFDSAAQMQFGENLSFTPWHSLPEHQPMGEINKARRETYQRTSALRHQLAGTLQQEPTCSTFQPEILTPALLDDRPVKQSPLTFIAKLKPDAEKPLKELLSEEIVFNSIGGNESKDKKVRFFLKRSSLTHFARFVILDSNIPDDKPDLYLYFGSNYDGKFADYMQELSGVMGTVLDKIFQHCEGYESGAALNVDRLSKFIKQHSVCYNNVFFNAHRGNVFQAGQSVKAIHGSFDLYKELKGLVESIDNEALRFKLIGLYQRLPTPVQRPVALFDWVGRTLAKPIQFLTQLWEKIGGVLIKEAAKRLLCLKPDATPDLTKVAGIYSSLRQSEYDRFKENLKVLQELEDKVTQNQITVLTPLKTCKLPFLNPKLDWYYRTFLTIDLFILNLLAPLTLPSLGTIHFARWVIVDLETKTAENRSRKKSYLLFESNYDGAWDGYIDSFVKNTGDGMNLIWGPCEGFPDTGVEDIEWFKYYIRKHQLPAQVFYSAYPDLAIEKIKRDRQLSQQAMGLVKLLHQKEVQQFLTNL